MMHGHTSGYGESRTYTARKNMLSRCYNPKHESYARYGARGVEVCARWRESFQNFLDDMGECPPGLTLDRFPNNAGDYEPGNCRWATRKQQSNNRKTTAGWGKKLRCYSGPRGEKTVPEWAGITGQSPVLIYERLRKGWPHKESVFGRPRGRRILPQLAGTLT